MTDREELIEEAEQGNRATEAREHRRLFEAAAREQLIAKAATAILAREGIEPQEDGTYWGENTWPNAVKDATTALAVFEKALGEAPVTPTVAEGTSDEREALARLLDRLEKLANAATPGPWEFTFGAPTQYGDGEWYEPTESGVRSDVWENDFPHADAEFIAAVDPQTVLAVIAALRAAGGVRDER